MAEKGSMDILLRNMKEQDARIEAEIQACVTLYRNVEKHTEYLERRTEEQEIFERMLQRISGKRGSFDDSETVRKLDSRVLAETWEIDSNNRLIREQQAYYEALRKKDIRALWGQEEEKSALAAICFAFEQGKETSDKIAAKLLSTRSRLPEQTARYLLEKALSYSESRNEADDIAEETDSLLRELFHRIRFPQSDAVWQNIEAFLNIRKTERAAVRYDALVKVYEKAKQEFDTFETGYDEACGEIREQIQDWKKKTGRETIAAVKSTEEWFDAKKAELDILVESRRNETARIDAVLQDLERFQADLKVCKESGAEPDDAMCVRLKSLAGEKVEAVETETLKQEKTKLLGTYDKYAEVMKNAEYDDIKKAKDDKEKEDAAKLAEIERKIREREKAKAKLREWFVSLPRKFAKGFIIIAVSLSIILCILCILEIVLAARGYSDLLGYLPNIALGSDGAVAYVDTSSPYYISLRPLYGIEVVEESSNENLSLLIMPFGAKKMKIDKAMENIKIHNGTEIVTLNCEKLKELKIPDSVKALYLYNVKDEFASTLSLPENLERFVIGRSPDLTEQGFAAMEIPKSVKNLRIAGLKNINIANDLEVLEVYAAEGATVNVNGAVQIAYIGNGGSLAMNVNGNVQTLLVEMLGGNVTKQLTVNGTGRVEYMVMNRYGENDQAVNLNLNIAPRALRLDNYIGAVPIFPEGIEILEILGYYGGMDIPYGSMEIPASVQRLEIGSVTLDFDAVNIPKGILYYKSYIYKDYDVLGDVREYRAENCPRKLVDFSFPYTMHKDIPYIDMMMFQI